MHACTRSLRPAALFAIILTLLGCLATLSAEEFRDYPIGHAADSVSPALSELRDARAPLGPEATQLFNGLEYHPRVKTGPPVTALRPKYELVPTQDETPNVRPRQKAEPVAAPAPQPGPAGLNSATDDELRVRKISNRYQDPRMLGFLRSTSMRQEMSLFVEAADLIDSRHVNPPSYEKRTSEALHGLTLAVENPEFLNAAGVSPREDLIVKVQKQLSDLARRPARSANESLAVMQQAAEIVASGLGVRPEMVALEFLNSTIDTLDRYSAFLPSRNGAGPKAECDDPQKVAGLEETIVGIGVELKFHPQGALVLGTMDGGPAQKAGLRKGDLIFSVDDLVANGKNLNQIADRISGPLGSNVRLGVQDRKSVV